tara:strand:- start:260 stop:592 length:333 start_codon:yes stop_codon:yes gene_type:complete
MLYVVLSTMLMYLMHLMLPTFLLLKNNSNVPNYVKRVHAATDNLKESLPVFFACAVLSIVTEVNSIFYAVTWLFLRITYLFCYIYEFNPYRKLIWIGSIICLILMALNLI